MTIVAVDNFENRLMGLVSTLGKLFPDGNILHYTDPLLALKHIFTHEVDIVFTESELRPLSGSQLGKVVREQRRNTAVYCITDTPEKTDGTCISAYLTKPVTADTIKSLF